jgi:Flp pilus assembly protein TadB
MVRRRLARLAPGSRKARREHAVAVVSYRAPVEAMSGRDRARQALLLGPGVGLFVVGLLSLFRHLTALGWVVLAVGVLLLLAYARPALRRRRQSRAAANGARE